MINIITKVWGGRLISWNKLKQKPLSNGPYWLAFQGLFRLLPFLCFCFFVSQERVSPSSPGCLFLESAGMKGVHHHRYQIAFYVAQNHLSGRVSPTVGRALPHQLSIKKMPYRFPTSQSDGIFSGFPLPRCQKTKQHNFQTIIKFTHLDFFVCLRQDFSV